MTTDSEKLRQYSAHFADYDVNISMELKRIADKLEQKHAMSAVGILADTLGVTISDIDHDWHAEVLKPSDVIRAMDEYLRQSQFSVVVPSDEEIDKQFDREDNYQDYYRNEGAMWVKNEILTRNMLT